MSSSNESSTSNTITITTTTSSKPITSQDLIQSIYTILNSDQSSDQTQDHLITLDCGHSISNDHHQKQTDSTNLIRCPKPNCDQRPQPIPSTNFTIQSILTHIQKDSHSSSKEEEEKDKEKDKEEKETKLIQTISTELECSLCSLIFELPSTTRCGHTFCKGCLERSLDYTNRCPVCRQSLIRQTLSIDQTIQELIMKCFSTRFQTTRSSNPSESQELSNQVSLFICGLAFPKLPTFLHVFEPHYRFLIRRSLSTNRRFGIVLPTETGAINQFGTLVEIKSIEFLQDGRSLVETIGIIRFEILNLTCLDGYQVANVKWIEDIDPSIESELDINVEKEESIEDLIQVCNGFVEVLRSGSTPWVLQRLNNTFGPTPTDPAQFSYWMAMVLPMSDQHKSQLLPITSVRLRLKLIVHWIHGFKTQWWFRVFFFQKYLRSILFDPFFFFFLIILFVSFYLKS
ncbi:uncharacterized protein MELLADRAFT_76217 [Melampsora larici-populina 98AG31]|uniref:RING-type domain-containing protein n=1 Tax=Melampsora larici-populina (strain 98AG31 / pathotype 3-4-7) TaxID=747676 RepID=F4R334_MELLP|nr:uncharacterized protein MELLADRAFT_76217 [Melampsora larici-populina 98AG31]EGG12559.1 hypothetical protein MELLADRAFT_76217 [Melampsora larici-populina 98AG31]